MKCMGMFTDCFHLAYQDRKSQIVEFIVKMDWKQRKIESGENELDFLLKNIKNLCCIEFNENLILCLKFKILS